MQVWEGREESGAGRRVPASEEVEPEPDAEPEEYEAREDELDPPRDYDDYTDNAHHEPRRE